MIGCYVYEYPADAARTFQIFNFKFKIELVLLVILACTSIEAQLCRGVSAPEQICILDQVRLVAWLMMR